MNKKYKKQVVEPDRVPATVEDTIPIQKIFEDGIFLVGRNLWSKTFEFSDVNYEVASKDAKEDMFLQYSAILNAIEDGATAKITISNRFIPRSEFEAKNMLPLQGDNLDRYRREYNSILERNVNLSTGVVQNKYFTITVEKSSIKEARVFFNRVGAEYKALFAKLGSRLTEVDEKEKIRIFFDFFHRGCEDDYLYDRLLTSAVSIALSSRLLPKVWSSRATISRWTEGLAE